MPSSHIPRVQCLAINESQDYFAAGLDAGLRVYRIDPLTESLNLSAQIVGSVQHVALLQRTNIIALVGGGPSCKFPSNSLLIYDACKKDFVLDITCSSPVLGVTLTHTRLSLILLTQIHLFTFPDQPTKLATFDTPENPRGLCDLRDHLIYPAHKVGAVHIVDIRQVSTLTSSPPSLLPAHKTELAYLVTNLQNTLLATASVTGTIIRLFDLEKRSLITELRRGSDPATLYSIQFSIDSAFLCCASDKATVHLFGIKDPALNRRSALQKVGIPSFDPLLDFARFSLPDESPTKCAFVAGAKAIVSVCEDGTWHKFGFSLDGVCAREGFDRFLEVGEDLEFWNAYKTQ